MTATPIQLRSRWSHFDTATHNLTVETAREIVEDLQAQLAALEPRDVMIAEAERQMVAAYSYAQGLNAALLFEDSTVGDSERSSKIDRLHRAVHGAEKAYRARLYVWSVLVDAREEAKGGST